MAFEQGFIGRTVSLVVTWLAVPRVATLPCLAILGISLGELLWHYADNVKILSWASGMATPFCLMCATVVWSMRDRLDDAFENENMPSQQYQRLVDLVMAQRLRATRWAAFTGLLALASSIPAVSNQLMGPVWHWMVIGAGAAVTTSVYAYLLANYWSHQLRMYRHKCRLENKRQDERRKLLDGLKASRPLAPGNEWVDGPMLEVPRAAPV